jgi:hypothetical protein
VRIDILTLLEGFQFSDIWRNRAIGRYGKETVYFIDRNSLIKSKQLSNRTQDKADLELLLNEE